MKTTFYVLAYMALAFVLASTVYLGIANQKALGASTPGLSARLASSTAEIAGTTPTNIAATSTNCSARIITTTSQAVMLTFSDVAGQTPTATYGHYQAGSTTVAYVSGLYGCGLIKAFSTGGANSNVTVSVTY